MYWMYISSPWPETLRRRRHIVVLVVASVICSVWLTHVSDLLRDLFGCPARRSASWPRAGGRADCSHSLILRIALLPDILYCLH